MFGSVACYSRFQFLRRHLGILFHFRHDIHFDRKLRARHERGEDVRPPLGARAPIRELTADYAPLEEDLVLGGGGGGVVVVVVVVDVVVCLAVLTRPFDDILLHFFHPCSSFSLSFFSVVSFQSKVSR